MEALAGSKRLGHWGVGLTSGTLGTTASILGNVKDFHFSGESESDKYHGGNLDIASGSIGLAGAGLDTVANTAGLLGNISGLTRGRRIAARKTAAGKRLGNKTMLKSGVGVAQSGLGMLSGLAGIASSASTLAGGIHTRLGNKEGAETSGKVGGAFGIAGGATQILNEGIGGVMGLKSLVGHSRRSSAAGKFAKDTANTDTDVKKIAGFASQNQNKLGGAMGLGKNALGMTSGVLGMTGSILGLAGANEAKKWVGVGSTVIGGLGTALGALQGWHNKRNQDKVDAETGTHATTLVDKLKAGNADAVKFANNALGLKGTADQLKQMAEEDPDALQELLKGKLSKYG